MKPFLFALGVVIYYRALAAALRWLLGGDLDTMFTEPRLLLYLVPSVIVLAFLGWKKGKLQSKPIDREPEE